MDRRSGTPSTVPPPIELPPVDLFPFLRRIFARLILTGLAAYGSMLGGPPLSVVVAERDRILPPVMLWRREARQGIAAVEAWANRPGSAR